jgi:hypothetical protein
LENTLAFLITLYEDEKRRLEDLIKKCLEDVEEPDYLLAHHHQRAIHRVYNTIGTLHRLEDVYYNDKQLYWRLIEKMEKDMEATESALLKNYFFEMLQAYREKIEKLHSIVPSSKSQTNSDILETTLVALFSKKIKKFKLIFNKSENVLLELSAKGQVIKIVSSFIKKNAIEHSDLDLLQKLGFQLTNKNKLVLELENEGDSTLIKLKFLLTRLVFDIAYFQHPAKENFIAF